jgi:hypothetical protein
MPRDFSHLVKTNLRRIAHPPREAECFLRILYLQVVLACLAHAAQETRGTTQGAECSAVESSRPGGMATPSSPAPGAAFRQPAPGSGRAASWEFFYGTGFTVPAVSFPAGGGPDRRRHPASSS